MIVEVKPVHFRNSKGYGSNTECPLALALKDLFTGSDIWVGGYDVYIDNRPYSISDNWRDVEVKQWIDTVKKNQKDELTVQVELINIPTDVAAYAYHDMHYVYQN